MFRGLAAIFLLLTWASCLGQETQLIQGVVSGGLTTRTAMLVQEHLGARPGVHVCRVDPHSRNIMLIVDPEFRLTEEGLRHFLRVHSMSLHCYWRGRRPDAPFRLLDPDDCGPQPNRQ